MLNSLNITKREFIGNVMKLYLEVLNKYIKDENAQELIDAGIDLSKTKENREIIIKLLGDNNIDYKV
jgi:hypothetical protein